MPHTVVIRHTLPEIRTHPDYGAGFLAGLVSGALLSVLMMGVSVLLLDLDAWAAPKAAYSLVAGVDAVRPGFEAVPVLAGVGIHFALAALYGLVFAWLAAGLPMGLSTLGAVFGFSLYAVNLVIAPSLQPSWVGHMFPPNALLHAVGIVEHVVFGLGLAFGYRALRNLPAM